MKKRVVTKPYTTAPINTNPPTISSSKPPFGYYGAKQRIASQIIGSLPPHHAWVEGFCGSAAITLAKAPAPIEIINDLDGQIVNVFKQLRENADALCRAVALTPYAREEFHHACMDIPLDNPLEKARRFLVATMMTVNSTVGSPQCGFSFSQSYSRNDREARVNRWYNLPDRLAEVVERLRNVRVENRDACELLEMFQDRPATLIYLDPPYFVKRNHKYVIDAQDKAFHEKLLKLCCKSKSMILLSGYDNELYRDRLTKKHGWTQIAISTKTRDTRGRDYERTEILWKNKNLTNAVLKGKVPIRLTKQEKEDNKVNPPRSR
ncbi:MAG: DNA adenine methylase [Sulfuricaulis sp.]|uniref:DNA adenine methylase n=1 Tax=Sulfuricaulis sp. TaxID=2003553 RepID=UPI0034A33B2C